MVGTVIRRVITPDTRFTPTIRRNGLFGTVEHYTLGVVVGHTRFVTGTLGVVGGFKGFGHRFGVTTMTCALG